MGSLISAKAQIDTEDGDIVYLMELENNHRFLVTSASKMVDEDLYYCQQLTRSLENSVAITE